MAINLPDLPYGKDALTPYIGATTLEFHHGKHHRAYVDNANKLLAGTALENTTPEEIIRKTAGDPAQTAIFNNVAQAWFGSGWVWLVLEGGTLKIVKTGNADNPLTKGMKPLLTIDVWEHAYYLDYQNRRPDYLATFIDKLINWDFVNANLDR